MKHVAIYEEMDNHTLQLVEELDVEDFRKDVLEESDALLVHDKSASFRLGIGEFMTFLRRGKYYEAMEVV